MPPSSNNNNNITTISSSTLIPNAHASAVTALAYLGCHHHTAAAAGDDGGEGKVSTTIRFASVGNDQRLKTWMLTIIDQTSMTVVEEEEKEEELGGSRSSAVSTVKQVGDWYTGVADAASLDAYYREEDDPAGTQEGGDGGGGGGGHWKLVVAGIGMEVRDV